MIWGENPQFSETSIWFHLHKNATCKWRKQLKSMNLRDWNPPVWYLSKHGGSTQQVTSKCSKGAGSANDETRECMVQPWGVVARVLGLVDFQLIQSLREAKQKSIFQKLLFEHRLSVDSLGVFAYIGPLRNWQPWVLVKSISPVMPCTGCIIHL